MGPLGPSGGMSSSRSILAGLGYTPVNKAGDTMLGDLKFSPDASFDIGKSGATRPRDGFFSRDLTAGGIFISAGSIFAGASSTLGFNGRSALQSSADGLLTLFNSAGTGFTRLNFGGTSSSFAAWTGGGTTLRAMLADGSGPAAIRALGLTVDSAAFLLTSSVAWANGAAAASGTLLNAPTAGNPTKWIAINDNGTTRYIPAW